MEQEKEIYCVLVKPQKYKEMYKQMLDMKYCYIPPLKEEKFDYVNKVETIYSYPVEISDSIEEDMLFVSKEEYDYYKTQDIIEFQKFMRDYVSDKEFEPGW